MEAPAGPAMNDFPLKERRHNIHARAHQSSLGLGLVPQGGDDGLPHITRAVATAVPSMQQPGAMDSTTGASSSHWVTSYTAATLHESHSKRPQGKRIVHQPTQRSDNLSTFIGYGGPVRREETEAALQFGTTKASRHIPGFTGHIPTSQASAAAAVHERNLDKSLPLLVMNYKPMPGYTGRLK